MPNLGVCLFVRDGCPFRRHFVARHRSGTAFSDDYVAGLFGRVNSIWGCGDLFRLVDQNSMRQEVAFYEGEAPGWKGHQ